MPDKTLPVILAVLGALAVLAAALFIDVQRAARRGPRWKRRLLTGGLALLAALGIGPGAAYATSPDGTTLVAAKRSLASTPEWKQIQAAWTEAAEVASGKRGSYPFDRAGQNKLLTDISTARKAVEALREQSQLSEAEALLLISDLDRFKDKVSGFRPTEKKGATCYKPMPYRLGRDTYTLVEGRVPLLEKMVAGPIKPAVAKKVLAHFEQDITLLADDSKTRDLTPEQRAARDQLLTRARAAMAKARAALKPPKPRPMCYKPMPPKNKRSQAPDALERRQAAADRVIAADRLSPAAEAKLLATLATDVPLLPAMLAADADLGATDEWKRIMLTWEAASAVARGDKGDYPFDRSGKQAMLAEMATAMKDIEALGESGELSAVEAGLLVHALSDLIKGVQAKRPTEMRAATCYGPRPYTQGRDALRRMQARLPLVEKLANAKRVRPEVMAKIIGKIEADLKTLASTKASRDLKGEQRKQAKQIAKRGTALVAKLKARRKPREPKNKPIRCYMPAKLD